MTYSSLPRACYGNLPNKNKKQRDEHKDKLDISRTVKKIKNIGIR